jgi:8-oxo-dGTP pyrophosphatase MutT (NUDIX family)
MSQSNLIQSNYKSNDKSTKINKKKIIHITKTDKPIILDVDNNTESEILDAKKDDSTHIIVECPVKINKIKKAKSSIRKTIYLDDDDAKPVTAGGVMIYKKTTNGLKVLVIETRGKYEDIGGKIDPMDNDIPSTVAREVEEETNAVIKAEDIIERIRNAPYVYVSNSKYVIYIVKATSHEFHLKKEAFGDKENHDGCNRTIGWILREELTRPIIVQCKMNWRIKNKHLFDKLIRLERKKPVIKLFKSYIEPVIKQEIKIVIESSNDDTTKYVNE